MLKILKILRRTSQNNCQIVKHNITTQPAQGNPQTSPEGRLNVLRSGTYRGIHWTLRGLIQKIMVYDFLIKLYFKRNSPFITYFFIIFFYKTTKYSIALNGDVYGL